MTEHTKPLTIALSFVRIGAIRYYLGIMVLMHTFVSYQLVDSISFFAADDTTTLSPISFNEADFIQYLTLKTQSIDAYILGYINALSYFWHFTFCAGLMLILLWCYRHAFQSQGMRNVCAITSWAVFIELLLGFPENLSMFTLETDYLMHETYNASAAGWYKILYSFRMLISTFCGVLILVGFTRWTLNTDAR